VVSRTQRMALLTLSTLPTNGCNAALSLSIVTCEVEIWQGCLTVGCGDGKTAPPLFCGWARPGACAWATLATAASGRERVNEHNREVSTVIV
jgi:hypothetical protein